jgi:SAM-dependent methyltransferase
MLKMYHRHREAGGSAAYWEEFGSEGTLADRLRFCDVDPLRPLFLRYLKPGSTMLEGGCGRGQYVAYYTARGVKVIGLDFAREWLASTHREMPHLSLCAGDVTALPFQDAAFDVYYSGGVVEHFEAGAEPALREARRVLKPNGVLLISVPYFSPLRRALVRSRRRDWRRVGSASADNGSGEVSRRFYQYAYTVREFERLLRSAGLRVRQTQGYAIAWGLYDLGAVARLARRFERRRGGPSVMAADHRTKPPSWAEESPARLSLLKRLAVAEDSSVPAAGWLVRAGRWACANMMMFVCTPSSPW